jgi:amino acid transporter
LKSAGVVVAGIFFRNVFGAGIGGRILSVFVIISAAGNIAATSFAQARVNEELAKDGLLPWSGFWTSKGASNVDAGGSSSVAEKLERHEQSSITPRRGLLLHWVVSVAAIVLPSGHVYSFLIDVGGYPVGVISAAVSLGLLYLYANPREKWTSPCRANMFCIVLFAFANVLLLILPWIPPSGSRGEGGNGESGSDFPYYAYPATAVALLASGALYWGYWRTWGNGKTQHGRAGGSACHQYESPEDENRI